MSLAHGFARSVLVGARRRLAHHRTWGPVLDEWDRWRVVGVLQRRGLKSAPLLGPADLAAYLPAHALYTRGIDLDAARDIAGAILRQDRLGEVPASTLALLRQAFHCTYMNYRYAVFERTPRNGRVDAHALRTLLQRIDTLRASTITGEPAHRPAAPARRARRTGAAVRRAALVTTFNRRAALQRSLPQITALGVSVLVVDDGSVPATAEANRALCEATGAAYVRLADNLGLPTALNVGLSMLMADPATEWISYFQDDVDVSAHAFEQLARVEDPERRPLISGYDADEHPVVETAEIGGIPVAYKRSTAAVHMHGHVEYWADVMPIPSPYVGAPKPRIGASMEDWWIVNHAPQSVEKRGLFVVCVPGLVRTFLWHRDDSTWDNSNQPDPPLAT